MDEQAFQNALKLVKIPILTLDQKWHRLFAISGKPEDVADIEKRLGEFIARQGQLNTDLKNYKNQKAKIQQQIVENIRGAEGTEESLEEEKHLDEFKQKIEELNAKIDEAEDEIKDLPRSIYDTNRELMMATMTFCYDKLRTNDHEIKDITKWIEDFKIELKRNIIRKQNREINNREIYSYMHDIFGMDVLSLFDVRYETLEEQDKRAEEEAGAAESKAKDGEGRGEDISASSEKSTITITAKSPNKTPPHRKENFNTATNKPQ